jgi:hypothetical protein
MKNMSEEYNIEKIMKILHLKYMSNKIIIGRYVPNNVKKIDFKNLNFYEKLILLNNL